ncbi:hypothetical protein DFH29DRAFT_1018529 [Suillus ampliporus]|nr:hypothetical protein DFH29DRAFT_1018529 [Suillus ampliporus]
MPFNGSEENLLPDIQSSLACASRQCSYLGDGDISSQGFSIRFMTSCTTNEPEVNDHQQHLSPATSQSVGYPESSQRTTSAFPSSALYDPQNFDYFTSSTLLSASVPHNRHRASHIPPDDRGWVSGQDVEQINLTADLDIQPLNYPGGQSPTGRVQASPDSASAEHTCPDDSDMETGLVMSQMMVHFQVHTPPPSVDMTRPVTDQDSPIPSIMTFRLGRQSLRPVTDPDNARILESFDDPDEDASEESCESLSPSSPPLLSPSSFYDRSTAGSCGDVIGTAVGVASPKERCSSYTPDEIHSFNDPDGNIHSPAPLNTKPRTTGSSKRSKMHQCTICLKIFPRPSGLNTHMNSHSGAKPYKCPVPSCDKHFAVRSNAKRHLKTHGINPSLIEGPSQGSNFTVGFEEPLVNHHVHDVGRPPTRLRWMPHSLTTRTQPVAGWTGSQSSGGDESEMTLPAFPVLSVLLPAGSLSSSNQASVYHHEDSNSDAEAGSRHYHPSQVRPHADS